ncbi:MAG: Xaa-Pro peptidase family protein [Desulfobaccales bacterium]
MPDTSESLRLPALRDLLSPKDLDAILISGPENRRYLSGFSADDPDWGVLLITQAAALLITDFRYQIWARQEAPAFRIEVYRQDLGQSLAQFFKELGVRRLGFEAAHLSYRQYPRLSAAAAAAGLRVEWEPVEGLVEELRETKSPDEMAAIRRALELSELVLRRVAAALAPGQTERQVAWEIEKGLREGGAETLAFPPIVAAGTNSARPHHQPGDRVICAGEPIIIDMGARLHGYCADITRTYLLGPPDERFKEIYTLVRRAQAQAERGLRAGMDSLAGDTLAREVISEAGYGEAFGHSLGHGVGLAVHENPSLNPNPERHSLLKPGSVLTVEPGIYLGDWGGVRLENMVLLEREGAEVLNRYQEFYRW